MPLTVASRPPMPSEQQRLQGGFSFDRQVKSTVGEESTRHDCTLKRAGLIWN